MMKRFLAAPLALAVFLLLPYMDAQAGQALSPGALKRLFPGSFHAVYKNYKVNLTARSGGALLGDFNGIKDTGRWSVKNGQLCISTKKWLKGKTHCSRVVVRGGWYRADIVKFRKGHLAKRG